LSYQGSRRLACGNLDNRCVRIIIPRRVVLLRRPIDAVVSKYGGIANTSGNGLSSFGDAFVVRMLQLDGNYETVFAGGSRWRGLDIAADRSY
jgi:hypothetical protein